MQVENLTWTCKKTQEPYLRPIVTNEGIDEALKNLRYTNKNSLKSKLINSIIEQYRLSGESIDSVNGIDTDFLVKTLWETGDDPELIRSRRKNFNSIKSTVNSDLKKLYNDGLNNEGIIINQKNIFDMSDEAKSEMLESFSYGGKGNSQIPLDKITDVLSVINDFISNKESAIEANEKFEQLKELIKDISGKVGISIVSQDGNAGAVYSGKSGEITALQEGLSSSDENNKQSFTVQENTNIEADEAAKTTEDEINEEKVDETDDQYEELELEDLPEEELEASDKDEVDIIDESFEEPVEEVGELEDAALEELEILPDDEIEEEFLEGDTEEVAEEEILDADEAEEASPDFEDVPVDEIEEFPEEEIVEDPVDELEDDEFEEVYVEEASEDELEDEIELIIEPVEESADEVDELEEIPEEEFEELPGEELLDDDIEEVPEDEMEDIPEEEIEEEPIDEFEDDEYEEIEVEDVPEEIVEEELEELTIDDPEDDLLEDVEDIPVDEVDIEEAPEDELEEGLEDEIELIEEPLEDATDEVDELEEVPDDEIEEFPFDDEEEEELPDNIEDIIADDVEDIQADEVDIEDALEDDVEIIDEPLEEALGETDEVEDMPEEELEELPEDAIEESVDEPIIELDDLDEIPANELEEVPEDEIDDLLEDDNDYTLEEILNDYDTNGYLSEEGQEKALILADRFDKMLSDTERYYNRYLLVPGGRFLIVNASPKIERKSQNYIDIPDFYFGKFPVTNHLFELFIEKTGYVTTAERLGYGMVYKGRYRYSVDETSGRKILEWNSSLNNEKVDGASWFQPHGPGSTLRGKRNHPVVQVTIEDAKAFAAWTGKRLPTEQEWEAAARTSSGLDYPWGRKPDKEKCNIEASAIGDTTPVDKYQKAINKYEIYDLLGNAMEWTSSSESQDGNITFVAKGGSWVSGDNVLLTSRTLLDPKSASNIVGFRCIAYK